MNDTNSDVETGILDLMSRLNVGRATVETLLERAILLDKAYLPVPLFGAAPPAYRKADWRNMELVTYGMLAMWGRMWPDSTNSGVLTRTTPMFNVDVTEEDAAAAIEDLIRERFEEAGRILVRFARPPRRAIPFRTSAPFAGTGLVFEGGHKLEFVGAGQQTIVAGIHPDTRVAVYWYGGAPGVDVAWKDLPAIDEAGARDLMTSAAHILTDKFGVRTATPPPPIRRSAPTRALDRIPDSRTTFTRDAAWRAARWRELQARGA